MERGTHGICSWIVEALASSASKKSQVLRWEPGRYGTVEVDSKFVEPFEALQALPSGRSSILPMGRTGSPSSPKSWRCRWVGDSDQWVGTISSRSPEEYLSTAGHDRAESRHICNMEFSNFRVCKFCKLSNCERVVRVWVSQDVFGWRSIIESSGGVVITAWYGADWLGSTKSWPFVGNACLAIRSCSRIPQCQRALADTCWVITQSGRWGPVACSCLFQLTQLTCDTLWYLWCFFCFFFGVQLTIPCTATPLDGTLRQRTRRESASKSPHN